MRVFALLLALVVNVQSACYLMSMGETCSVCWKKVFKPDGTSATGGATKCPDGIKLEWVEELPELMIEGQPYLTKYKFTVNSSQFQPVSVAVKKGESLKRTIPHANIHSCIAKNGQCVPFISNTPGLATHTTALNADFKNDVAILTSEVTLTKDVYTVIAHGRFKMLNEKNSSLGLTQYDVAIGTKREVTVPQAELSPDSMITSGVAAVLMTIFIGSFVVAAKKGAINAEAWLMILTGEMVILAVNVILGLGDVSAFTLSIYSLASSPNSSPEAYQAVPLAIIFASVAWIVSFIKLYNDIKQVYLIKAFNAGQNVEVMSEHIGKVYVGNSANHKTLGSGEKKDFTRQLSKKIGDENIQENEEKLAALRLLAKTDRAVTRKWYALLAIITEAIPISGITIYIMLNVEEISVVNVLSLLFSALVLGANAAGLTQFARLRRNRNEAINSFTSHFGVEEIQVRKSEVRSQARVHPLA